MATAQNINVKTRIDTYDKSCQLFFIDTNDTKIKEFSENIIYDDYDFRHSALANNLAFYRDNSYDLVHSNLFYSLYLPQLREYHQYEIRNPNTFIAAFTWFKENEKVLATAYNKIKKKIYYDIRDHSEFYEIYTLLNTVSDKLKSIDYLTYTEKKNVIENINIQKSPDSIINSKFKLKLMYSLDVSNVGLFITTYGLGLNKVNYEHLSNPDKIDIVTSMFMFNTYTKVKLSLKELLLVLN